MGCGVTRSTGDNDRRSGCPGTARMPGGVPSAVRGQRSGFGRRRERVAPGGDRGGELLGRVGLHVVTDAVQHHGRVVCQGCLPAQPFAFPEGDVRITPHHRGRQVRGRAKVALHLGEGASAPGDPAGNTTLACRWRRWPAGSMTLTNRLKRRMISRVGSPPIACENASNCRSPLTAHARELPTTSRSNRCAMGAAAAIPIGPRQHRKTSSTPVRSRRSTKARTTAACSTLPIGPVTHHVALVCHLDAQPGRACRRRRAW